MKLKTRHNKRPAAALRQSELAGEVARETFDLYTGTAGDGWKAEEIRASQEADRARLEALQLDIPAIPPHALERLRAKVRETFKPEEAQYYEHAQDRHNNT